MHRSVTQGHGGRSVNVTQNPWKIIASITSIITLNRCLQGDNADNKRNRALKNHMLMCDATFATKYLASGSIQTETLYVQQP